MRTAAFALLSLVATAVPARGGALEWVARAGLDYWRQDVETQGVRITNEPRFDVNLILDAHGFFVQPDVIDWNAGVAYRRLRASYEGTSDSVTAGLSYHLRSVFFGSRVSPFTVTAFADHSADDVSFGQGPSGSVQSTSFGTTARLTLQDRPRIDVGYTRLESLQSNPILGRSRVDRDRFSAGLGYGTQTFGYSAEYSAMLSKGTFATDNYDEHRARAAGNVTLSRRARLQLSDTFYRRTPTVSASVNPRQDLNHFDLRLMDLTDRDPRDLASRDFQEVSYSYTAGLSEAPGLPVSSRAAHRALFASERRLPAPEWSVRGTVTATYQEQALGAETDRSAGQTLATLVYWRRANETGLTELFAGPTVGGLERFDGVARLGKGASAGAIMHRAVPTGNVRGSYTIDYASEAGEPGWFVSQQVSLGADRPVWTGIVRGQLFANARRAEAPLFGTTASRSVMGITDYTTRKALVELRLGIEDGLTGALRNPGAGDALFIAPSYDSHVRYASVRGTLRIVGELRLTGAGRISSTELPDRPSLSELEGRAGMSYVYGGFGFSFEDQYVVSSGVGAARKVNQMLFQVYRIVGGGR